MTPPITTTVDSPVGMLTLSATDGFLTGMSMHGQRHAPPRPADGRRDDAWFAEVVGQLDAYFAGDLTEFEFPMRLDGTDFQRRGLVAPPRHSLRRDDQLRRAGPASGQPQCLAGRRVGQRAQSDRHHRPLPSGHRRQRSTDRIRRRAGTQDLAPRPRGRPSDRRRHSKQQLSRHVQ